MNDTYVPKAIEVEAKQWDGTMAEALDVLEWLAKQNIPARFLETNETVGRESPEIVIGTPDGNKHVRAGNWITNDGQTILLFTSGTFRRQYKKKEE